MFNIFKCVVYIQFRHFKSPKLFYYVSFKVMTHKCKEALIEILSPPVLAGISKELEIGKLVLPISHHLVKRVDITVRISLEKLFHVFSVPKGLLPWGEKKAPFPFIR